MAATDPSSTAGDHVPHDRVAEITRFEDSKLGVKGLVDSGLGAIPGFFIHPAETLSSLRPGRPGVDLIPTIDLAGADSDRRAEIVERVSRACRELGFFQIINHGVPVEALDRAIGAVRAFHEGPPEEKAGMYTRETKTGVSFFSNIDLFQSKAASWRDTLQIRLAPTLPSLEDIPEVCRSEVVEWNQHIQQLGSLLLGLLSEGLGLDMGRLEGLTCLGTRIMVAHYYPYCPEPDRTVGIASHTDPGVITLLLQNHMGGLQIKKDEEWVEVEPVPGALVINVGDILQVDLSCKSVGQQWRLVKPCCCFIKSFCRLYLMMNTRAWSTECWQTLQRSLECPLLYSAIQAAESIRLDPFRSCSLLRNLRCSSNSCSLTT
ncbi:hypothetical protein SAY86_026001 [Trapa natans]|uniref:Fe2OG dioxygenase domain-containing protein n=1 Tax=Trapa natans TaxID=22666 RepID=A0AAN7QE41_TRANT|nr:hypothetical protein SAY86_026001 [Trapa natans]